MGVAAGSRGPGPGPLAGILFLLIPAMLTAQLSSFNGAPKYAPGNGRKLLILGQDLGAVGGLDDYSDGYVDHLNHVPAGVTTYTGFPSLGGLAGTDNWGSGDVCAQAYLEDSTFDQSAVAIGLHMVDQLGTIINGGADSIISVLGSWIKETERPVFLRIGYEFDGDWNHYNTIQYKQAWIYMVHQFDELGVKNVAYVWQAHGGNTPNIEKWYPGDEYVNWVGYSHFDEPDPGMNILSFAETHNKPVLIAEATPRVDLKSGLGEDHWNTWFGPLFERIYTYDRIKALAYINVDWESQQMWTGQGWGDSRIQVNDVVKTKWEAEIQKDAWILATDTLFDLLDYALWQDSVIGMLPVPVHLAEEGRLEFDPSRMQVKESGEALLHGIRVFDMSGRIVYQQNKPAYAYQIPVIRSGGGSLLLIQVKTDDRILTRKVFTTD